MKEIYINEIELEILTVFIKRKILVNQDVREVLEELIRKLQKNQEN